jgi:hypothetical protein
VRWVLLTTAPDQLTAEMWAKLLQGEGIPATIKPGDAVSFLGVSAMPCRLLVPEGRVGEARAVLAEYRGETGL